MGRNVTTAVSGPSRSRVLCITLSASKHVLRRWQQSGVYWKVHDRLKPGFEDNRNTPRKPSTHISVHKVSREVKLTIEELSLVGCDAVLSGGWIPAFGETCHLHLQGIETVEIPLKRW